MGKLKYIKIFLGSSKTEECSGGALGLVPMNFLHFPNYLNLTLSICKFYESSMPLNYNSLFIHTFSV